MSKKLFLKTRLFFTAIVAMATWSLLAWNYYHRGVPSHHILHREDLPAISNWWDGLLLPLLTWFLLYRIQQRLLSDNVEKPNKSQGLRDTLYRFTGALFFGISLSVFFTLGYSSISGFMIIVLFLLGLFFPIYRAECILGFVIGMTFTFGAALPTAFGAIFALISAILYRYVRPVLLYIASRLVRTVSTNKQKSDK
ncbi:MAG TPA: hypothetical protein VFP87_09150 [Chitinophagaceae bacterium]|nr:hypothetical protein [Chitinophagaceae bacterium]